MTDSIIQEVRAISEQHAASMNYDLDCIFLDLKARQEKHAKEGWVIISPPEFPPPNSNLELQRIRFIR